jgi:5-methylcytosine-specific restriction endonuclease McrA
MAKKATDKSPEKLAHLKCATIAKLETADVIKSVTVLTDSNSAVKTKKQIYLATYQIKNAEKIRETKRAYAAKHVESLKAYQKSWRIQNAEKLKAAKREWAKNNPKITLESQARWRRNNPDIARERPTAWRRENPDRAREIAIKWYRNNADSAREYKVGYRKTNREKLRVSEALWRRNNREKIAKWFKDNYEKVRQINAKWRKSPNGKLSAANARHMRRSKKKGCLASVTTKELSEIKKTSKGFCFYCKQSRPLTLDHVIPLSKGGSHTKENIVMACGPCNFSKHTKPVGQFINEKGFDDVEIPAIQLHLNQFRSR